MIFFRENALRNLRDWEGEGYDFLSVRSIRILLNIMRFKVIEVNNLQMFRVLLILLLWLGLLLLGFVVIDIVPQYSHLFVQVGRKIKLIKFS
jgi:hypothetical protein